MEIYTIEQGDFDGAYHNDTTKYRFRSLYNGCVGNWCYSKKEADEEGRSHQKIIEKLHNYAF